MNKKNFIWAGMAVFGALWVAGCTGMTPSEGKRLTKYTPPAPPSAYGEWYVDAYSCTIRARAEDFSLVVDPVPYKGTLKVKALFLAPQARVPGVEISELLAPVPIEGMGRGYGIILAYDAQNAAHMLKQDTFLMVQYQPLNSGQVLESHFQTKGLMLALADVANYCEP